MTDRLQIEAFPVEQKRPERRVNERPSLTAATSMEGDALADAPLSHGLRATQYLSVRQDGDGLLEHIAAARAYSGAAITAGLYSGDIGWIHISLHHRRTIEILEAALAAGDAK